MPHRVLALPFGLAVVLFLVLAWRYEESYALWAIPPGIMLGAIIPLGPQIDWWWYKRFPPKLDQVGRHFLEKFDPFFQALNAEERKRAESRIRLWQFSQNFKSQAEDELPEEVSLALAASAVQLTWGMADFQFTPFETIVIYPKPFPSPQYLQFHASELYEEDGVLLFSAQHVLKGFTQWQHFYDLGMHELAHALIRIHPEISWPELPETIWEQLQMVSGFHKQAIVDWIGRPDVEPLPATIVHLLHFPDKFQTVLPELTEQLTRALQQNRTIEL